jgi:Acyl-protein synthetase, LuxE
MVFDWWKSGIYVLSAARTPRVCNRPGPVLEPEIHRAKGEEVRGCAEQQESAKQAAKEQVRKIFATTVEWLERFDKTTDRIHIPAPPALFSVFMDALDRMGKHYELGARGSLMTGGGWKTLGNQVISAEHFRQRVEDVFGIPETRCRDLYGMVEMNAMLSTCREGHYYHIPYTWLKPFVLDHTLTPVGYGEWGRFAFLDALARSYPGFVMTGDQVRLLEHCPVCDRPGPALDRVIKRMPSEDMRGCAEELRRVFNQDLAGALAG